MYADGRCPSAETSVNQPPVCEVDAGKGKWTQSSNYDSLNDFAQMRALGFNLIRLAMSWSLLEPAPSQYSTQYLDRISQLVDWAAEQDIQVVLDMHQDGYGPSIGDDGAAAWACLNVTVDAWVEDLWPKISSFIPYSKTVLLAFDALFTNQPVLASGKGLQEHFLLAWTQVIKRFDNKPNVIGYEILNEPVPGLMTVASSLRQGPVLGFSTDFLYPMYKRFIQAVTGVRDGLATCPSDKPVSDNCAFPDMGIRSERLVLFEPMALRNQVDISLQISKPFTEYKNIVFSPHTYTREFTAKGWTPPYRLALDSAWSEANLMGASVLVTEFGGSSSNSDIVGNITEQLDVHRGTSGTVWTWKEFGGWGLFNAPGNRSQPNGPLIDIRRLINSRVYAPAVDGGILEHRFDHLSASFRLTADAGPGWTVPTEIYIPPHIDGEVSVKGTAELSEAKTQPDRSRLVQVKPWLTGGVYRVEVGRSLEEQPEGPSYRGVTNETMHQLAEAMFPVRQLRDSGRRSLAPIFANVSQEIYSDSALII
eukprot:TRINITY_DN29292_c0_g1_i1.p1 TRINITY_DN29292_c0_g1~~TRINITY_DN29292_c0_g1_i1.p1  ORF type:complete len:628 (-),score=60.22 TRINITY_DN29292_c0_g1_i1:61-1665(-)